MIKGYIFDTSIWIDFFKGNNSDQTRLLIYLLENDLPVYYCPVILQEVLQGIKKDTEFKDVKDVFTVLNKLVEDPYQAAIGAAEICRNLRKKGITIRNGNDCLIAWYGIKNDLEIIHCDRDYNMIKENIAGEGL